MVLPDLKKLKKLAQACRKAGIKTIKCDGIEITLSDYEPALSSYKQRQSRITSKQTSSKSSDTDQVESDDLSEDALLFWSTTAPGEEKEGAN